jgi:rSAM/selenodomain-associated transferase 2/rSAM/selenodomain-associated transferase 1
MSAMQQTAPSGAPPSAHLTIIIPVLNERSVIASILASLAPFRERGVEVVVVDGGSKDGTLAAAGLGADELVVGPSGRARQMNAGAAAAHAPVLLFLHADSELPDSADESILKGLAATGREWGRFDVRIEGSSRWLPFVAWLMNLRSRLTGIATGDQAMFVTRRAFDALGGFPDQALMEDVELSSRLLRRGRPLCLRPPVVTSGRRWVSCGVRRTIVLMWWLRLLYFFGVAPDRLARLYQLPVPVDSTTIMIFAKAPVPGAVKTRLIPALGSAGAAQLALRMLEHALQVAADARLGPVQLHCAPDAGHAALQAAAARAGAACLAQRPGDLGERMRSALVAALQISPRALLLGTDCPALDGGVLREADAALASGADSVFVPTADGGFALTGFRREALAAIDEVFAEIPWSTSAVMSSARAHLLCAGLRWTELATLVDVDEPEDLIHVPVEWLKMAAGAPAVANQ